MGLTTTLGRPPARYFTGRTAVGDSRPEGAVNLGGHWYLLDLASTRYSEVTLEALRPQQDTSERPGEQTLSTQGLWRRAHATWVHGAGQEALDRHDSDPRRFQASRGLRVHEPWQLTHLAQVAVQTSRAGGWTSMVPARLGGVDRLVAGSADGQVWSTNGTTAVTATVSGRAYVASTGGAAYVTSATGILRLDDAATGTTVFNANVKPADLLVYVKGRLMAAVGPALYDVVDGATSAPLFTNPWPGFVWTGFAEGAQVVYAAGYAGDRGQVWAIPLKEDGTGLDAPRVAVELPDGEVPLSVAGYVGYVVVGTSRGLRLAQVVGGGGLVLGPIVGEAPVRCLEPQDRFVWFGWDSAFSDASGLGRVDLSRFVEPLAPSYATDLMAPTLGATTAVATYNGKRWFAVGEDVLAEQDTLLTDGWYESGWISFGITDPKIGMFVDLQHTVLKAGDWVSAEVGTDRQDVYTPVGRSDVLGLTGPSSPLPLQAERATVFRVRVALHRGTAEPLALHQVTLSVQPSPARTRVVFLPLLLHEVVTVGGVQYQIDVNAELDHLRGLVAGQQVVQLAVGGRIASVFCEEYEWLPYHADPLDQAWSGTCVVKAKFVNPLP